jgi:hypothetical protein
VAESLHGTTCENDITDVYMLWTAGIYMDGAVTVLAAPAPGGGARLIHENTVLMCSSRLVISVVEESEGGESRGGVDVYVLWTLGIYEPHAPRLWQDSRPSRPLDSCSGNSGSSVGSLRNPLRWNVTWTERSLG